MSGMADWMSMTHDQIYQAVQRGPGGGAAMLAEDAWRDVRDIIVAAESRANSAIAGSVGEWEGGGAEAARGALSTLNGWVLDSINDAGDTLAALTEQGFNAESFRRAVPPPHAYELFEAQVEAQANPNSREAAERAFRAESAAQDPQVQAMGETVKDRMRDYFNQSYANLGIMSFWSIPPAVTVDTTPVVPAGGGPGGPAASGYTPADPSGGGAPQIGGSGVVPAALVPGAVPAASGSGAVPAGLVPGAVPAVTGSGAGPAGLIPGAMPAMGGSGAVPTGFVTGAVPAVGGSGAVPAAYVPGGVPAGGGSGAPAGSTAVPAGREAGLIGGGPATGAGAAPVPLGPGAGGRGVRPVPDVRAGSSGGGVQPVVPRVPTALAPSPTWRDLVARGSGESPPVGRPVAGPIDGRPGGISGGPGGSSGGSGSGGSAHPLAPRADIGPRLTAVGAAAEAGRGGSIGGTHGLYPPMAGGGQGQGQERRRAPFLIDDSGVFDVDVPCVEPVIGGEQPTGPPREA